MKQLPGRTAFITGGASGIGLATAELFGQDGASVFIADLESSEGQARADELRARGMRCAFIPVDVTVEEDVRDAIGEVLAATGGLHSIVASAGIRGNQSDVSNVGFEEWRRVMAVNLDGVFLTLKHGVPALVASGGGTVVVVSSISATRGDAGWAPYAASKAGVVGLVRSAALESVKHNVRINAVCPGYVDTPMAEDFVQGSSLRRSFLGLRMPIGRIATAPEIAAVVHFLSTEQSSFLIGAAIPVDGGFTA